MKKIVSLLSASVLALSLIGCSGDLHDTDASPLFIEGDCWGTRTALAFDGDEQVIEFKYEDNDDCKKWGGSAGTVNFKIMTEAVGWNDDFGAAKDETLELKINDDFVDTHSRKNEGIGGAGPGNIVLKDLAEGSKYKIHVKYDSAANTAKIKVTGNVTDWPALRLEGKDGTTYKLERTGSIYKYTFTPEKEGSLEFYISNGYLYWGANEKITAVETKVDMSTTKPTDYLKVEWSKANIPYSLSIDAKELLKDGDKPVSVKFGAAYITILSEAALQGIGNNWDAGSANLNCESETVYTYDFKNTGAEMEFAIQKKAGDWTAGRWFAGIPDGKERAATGLAGDIVAAKYNATATSVTPIYYPKDAGMDGKNLKVTGLPYKTGHNFKMTITIVNSATQELSITVAAQESIPDSDYEVPANVWAGFTGIAAGFNNSHDWKTGSTEITPTLSPSDANKASFEFTAEEGYTTYFVGMRNGNWSVRYEAATGDYTIGEDIPTSTTELSNANRGLVTVESGKTYVVTATKNNDTVKLVVTEK